MVLGASAYKQGVRATVFSWADKGIHYFVALCHAPGAV